jgi:hypothetical protein
LSDVVSRIRNSFQSNVPNTTRLARRKLQTLIALEKDQRCNP